MQNDYTEKILVVDDEPLIRFVFAEALRSWGHVPLEASTIAEALNLFTVEQPQAALLDIELGYSITRSYDSQNLFRSAIRSGLRLRGKGSMC
jgi:CheY-like chemotaxis protein